MEVSPYILQHMGGNWIILQQLDKDSVGSAFRPNVGDCISKTNFVIEILKKSYQQIFENVFAF